MERFDALNYMLIVYIQFARCDVKILEYTKYTDMLCCGNTRIHCGKTVTSIWRAAARRISCHRVKLWVLKNQHQRRIGFGAKIFK